MNHSAPDRSRLAALVSQLKPVRVLVVGDLFLDRYSDGVVERISPEAGAPILRITSEGAAPGGAGNVAANAASLGARVELISLIGEDEAGAQVRVLLDAAGIDTGGLVAIPGRRTAAKTRFRATGRHLLRADDEQVAAISETDADRLVAEVRRRIGSVDALIISDYGKGIFLGDVATRLIAVASDADVPAIVDPKGTDYARYRGADVVTPNLSELSEAVGRAKVGRDEAAVLARDLLARHGFGGVVVTLGDAGAVLVEEGREAPIPSRPVLDADANGAGDTLAAALGVSIASGLDRAEALLVAGAAAEVVCAKSGTATARLDEMTAPLPPLAASNGPTDFEHARELVAMWRRQGLSIGFTNGCFDVVHAGHLHLLEQARAECDRLIIGLNSDESVRRLKGEGRPIHRLEHRARVLLGMRAVDMVVPFSDPTPISLIEAFAPDVLVKGSDYTVSTVVGAEIVFARGGRVLLADIVEDLGTTATLQRLEEARR